ncbi:MAG: methyltransferase family protein [Gaiellaceae bacterium]
MAVIGLAWLLPPAWPDAVRSPLRIAGLALAAAGAAFIVWASHTLGNALTPFPRPRAGASLVERSPYRLARHPMYGGGLLVFGGVSLARSVPSLVLTVLLAVLWWRKSLAEEERLERAYPEYPAYRERTPHRFLPYVL